MGGNNPRIVVDPGVRFGKPVVRFLRHPKNGRPCSRAGPSIDPALLFAVRIQREVLPAGVLLVGDGGGCVELTRFRPEHLGTR